MAMYYYASKLNEASCSGCHSKSGSTTQEESPAAPPASLTHPPLPTDTALLHGSALSYYDNEDYYSMVRGSKFVAESACKHVVMNGAINYVTSQSKSDDRKLAAVAVAGGGGGGGGVGGGGTGGKAPAPPAGEGDVEYREGQLVAAPLESLVEMLRPGASKGFVFTLLLCSRLYIKPHELLAKLCKRYFKSYEKIGKQEARDMVDKELSDMAALVRILRQWTSSFPYDFRDDRVMALVRTITQRCAAEHMASMREEVSLLLQKLLERLTALEQYEETLADTPQVGSVDQLQQGDVLTLGLSPAELAHQLSAVELQRLSFVGPEEFVQTFAPAAPQPPAAAIGLRHADAKSTRNLEAYADWFNTLSYLVATDIVKAQKTKYRARVIEQWVMTARECFNLGNFNSLMAIISALNMAPVARLKKTWGRTSTVCGQQLRQLELCVEPGGNHARYRAALAAAPTETAVPLLSVTCRDLHFANQGAPSKVSGGRVNFEKCQLLARHVGAALARRRLADDLPPAPPPPAPHPPVWRYLNRRPLLTELGMELASFEREPPADHIEKERYKRIRLSP